MRTGTNGFTFPSVFRVIFRVIFRVVFRGPLGRVFRAFSVRFSVAFSVRIASVRAPILRRGVLHLVEKARKLFEPKVTVKINVISRQSN